MRSVAGLVNPWAHKVQPPGTVGAEDYGPKPQSTHGPMHVTIESWVTVPLPDWH